MTFKTTIMFIIMFCVSLRAQTVPYNQEFEIIATNKGYSAVSSGLLSDGFVICWTGIQNDGDIIGQIYNENCIKEGEEFLVNTVNSGIQKFPSISGLTSGGFVICWESDQDGTRSSIYSQIFNNDGTKRGEEFRVNTFINNWQENPRLDDLSGGGFVICWSSFGQDGDGDGIFGQIYENDGTRRGDEFRINTYTDNFQNNPDVAALSDGGFIVCWHSQNQDSDHKGIYGQLYEKDGTRRGNEFRINTYITDDQSHPNVCELFGGGFVVTWNSLEQDGSGHGIYAQIYDNNGNKMGEEFLVNTYTNNSQSMPKICGLKDGEFIVCWQSFEQDGSWYGIYAQIFHNDGQKHGLEFRVNTQADRYQWNPEISSLSNGDFIICWDNEEQNGFNTIGKYFLGYPILHSLKSFSLTLPEYDATLSSKTANFKWHGASNTHMNFPWELEYSLYLDRKEQFYDPQIIDEIIDTTTTVWDLSPGQTYFWKVLAKNIEGDSLWSSESFGFYVSPAANIKDDQILKPETFKLHSNYPNPFNPRTIINYELPITNYVEVSIYNLLGQKVVSLVSEKQNAGYHQIEWDATGFTSGVYILTLEAGKFRATQKMFLVK